MFTDLYIFESEYVIVPIDSNSIVKRKLGHEHRHAKLLIVIEKTTVYNVMKKFSFIQSGPEILHAYFNTGFSRCKLHEPGRSRLIDHTVYR